MSAETAHRIRATCRTLSVPLVIAWFAAFPTADAATRNAQVTAEHGMVASAHVLASRAGVEILKAGGNAVDAAVATAFAVGVVEPNASGIGGEGMMLIWRPELRDGVAIDYRSVAPATASFAHGVPSTGHAAVSVPGTVAGLALALQRYGTMSLSTVLAPAIRLAEEGFVVGPTLAGIINDSYEPIMKNEPLAALLCPEGLPLEASSTLRNPALAASLRKIAEGGSDVFYRGELADAIVREAAASGGFLSKSDLAAYRALVRRPVRGEYRGVTVLSAPPPVGGTPVIEALQILDRFKLRKGQPLAPESVHLVAEALKRASADYHAFVADPDFVSVPLARLLSRDYAKKRAREIDVHRMTPKIVAEPPHADGGPSTTSLVVADAQGALVSVTQTISDFFGAKVMVAGTGIILNNEMKNFSSSGVNAMAPGKRMRTTIAPTVLVRRSQPLAAFGTPGGARITSTTVELVSHLIDHQMGIQDAIETPRFFARDTEQRLFVEDRVPKGTLEALRRLGYTFQIMKDYDLFFGGAQAIVVDRKTGRRIGGADPRRDGTAVGY